MAEQPRFYMPPAELPITQPGPRGLIVNKPWYVLFSQLYAAVTDGIMLRESAVTVGASPFTYTATVKGQLNIAGGAGLTIEFTRDGTTFYPAGVEPCMIAMSKGDRIRITYGGAPSLTFFPM